MGRLCNSWVFWSVLTVAGTLCGANIVYRALLFDNCIGWNYTGLFPPSSWKCGNSFENSDSPCRTLCYCVKSPPDYICLEPKWSQDATLCMAISLVFFGVSFFCGVKAWDIRDATRGRRSCCWNLKKIDLSVYCWLHWYRQYCVRKDGENMRCYCLYSLYNFGTHPDLSDYHRSYSYFSGVFSW